tara:strand:- start:1353 stop:2249 length:897 start_codon:yes stop_codon:yes gene_type:complete
MDRRKFVNFSILNQVRSQFIQKLKENNIELHCILGNHDVYYRNTNGVNSVTELFSNDIKIYEIPTIINLGGLDIALLPWVNKENYDNSVEFIKTAPAPILIGHLELNGYQVLRGVKHSGGMNPDILERYEKVLSGHFHCRQEKDNVYYMGTQYQITFADLEETKGFHILDTETRDIEFIENPNRMFHKVYYNDEEGPVDTKEMNFSHLKDSYVRLDVEYKKHPYSFDKFMDTLIDAGVAKITVIEESSDILENEEELVDLAQDTVTLINNEIDLMEEVDNKDKLKKLIKDLYMESLSL